MDERVWGDLVYGVVHDMVERACEVSCLLRGSVVFRSCYFNFNFNIFMYLFLVSTTAVNQSVG